MQHLLCRATWDTEAVRDDVREYVVEHLHDEAAVLVVDEIGDVKKGAPALRRAMDRHAGFLRQDLVAVTAGLTLP